TGTSQGCPSALEWKPSARSWSCSTKSRPAMAADLVRRQVVVIAATSTPAALAAKAATASIPIVFETGFDPILLGLVSNLRLEVLHQLLPMARVMALLVNPSNPIIAETDTTGARSAASNFGVELHVLNASIEHEFDALFPRLIRLVAAGLVI